MKKRILSIVLAVLMLVSVLPISALAAEYEYGAEEPADGYQKDDTIWVAGSYELPQVAPGLEWRYQQQEKNILNCGREAHVHTMDCWQRGHHGHWRLICGKQEHRHDRWCYTRVYLYKLVQKQTTVDTEYNNLYLAVKNGSYNAFPDEPTESNYSYTFYNKNYQAESYNKYDRVTLFDENASKYIDKDAFFNTTPGPKPNTDKEGVTVWGFYDPDGLKVNELPYLTEQGKAIIAGKEQTIISAYLNEHRNEEQYKNTTASDWELLVYVIKYEEGMTKGWHIDCTLVPKPSVKLIYDANFDWTTYEKNYDKIPDVHVERLNGEDHPVKVEDLQLKDGQERAITNKETGEKLVFAGWNTEANGTGTWYYVDDTVTLKDKDVTLYAQWSATTITISKTVTGLPEGYTTAQTYSFTSTYGSDNKTSASASVQVTGNGTQTATLTLTGKALGKAHTITETQPSNITINGVEYTCSVLYTNGQTALPGSTISVVNEWHAVEPETKTLTITKEWFGLAATDARPAVTFLLTQKKDDVATGYTKTFTLDGIVDIEDGGVETSKWTATIEVPEKDTDGKAFEYSVRETKIGDISVTAGVGLVNVTEMNSDNTPYTVATWKIDWTAHYLENTYSFKNTYSGEQKYTLTYQFVDGEKPEGVTAPTVETYYKDQRFNLATVREPSGWKFDGWYSTEDCNATDKVADPYRMPANNVTLYGKWTKNTPTTTTINVTKQWGEGVTATQKQEVTVRLLDNGVSKWADITLNEENKWTGTFTVDYDAGARYSVVESKIGNEWFAFNKTATIDDTTWEYQVTGNAEDGFTITNSIKKGEQPPVGEVSVSYEYKKDDWNVDDYADIPADDLAAIKEEYPLPENTTVAKGGSISAPITPEEGDKVTVANGEWEFVKWDVEEFKDLDHDAVFKGLWKFTAKETIDITVKKSWVTERYNEDLKTPDSVEVALLQNGEQYATATLHWSPSKNNISESFAHKFENLPKYDAEGKEYVYTVEELGDKIARSEDGKRIGIWEDEYKKTAEGWHITNTLKEDGTEPEYHEFTAHIVKRFENKSGKSPKATFTFIAALKDGTEVGRETISFAKGDVDAGKIGRDDVTMTVTLTDDEYDNLETDKYGPYLWIYEEDGDVNGVKYDTEPQKAYIYEKPVAWSLELDEDGELVLSVPDKTKLYCLVGDEMVEDFVFTNTYKKPGEKGETIKSGPQLNRDDHVAYIMGYPDGTVQPEGEITRAEACTIFFRLLTDSSRDYYFARTNDYSDVNAGDWFNNAISTLSNAGIVTGYNDGTFRPNQPITRGEMAKIIANFANLNNGGKTFTDLAGHWSKTYVELAAGNGWIAGYPDGSFRPDQKITRAETVTMINRVLDRVPAKESRLLSRSIMLTFPDNNPGDWYYIAIQEASNSHEYQRSVYEAAGDEMWTKLIENVDWTKLEK